MACHPARLLLFVLLLTWAVSVAAFAPRPVCVGALMRPTGSGAGTSPSDGDGEDGALDLERHGAGEEATAAPSSMSAVETRRRFLHQQILASVLLPTLTLTPWIVQAADSDWADQRNWLGLGLFSRKWTPFANVQKWDSAEKCLLEMLPVTNPVFRQLQHCLEDLEAHPPGDARGWRGTLLDALSILTFLETKRGVLEPALAPADSLEVSAAKGDLGQRNLAALRARLSELADVAAGDIDLATVDYALDDLDTTGAGEIDTDAFAAAKRRTLLALSELGELLVPSFPYAVPARGKFGYLPRLLGRCCVTFSFERPAPPSSAFRMTLSGADAQPLGNVTIIADGYAAPITAGNFVDLSKRQFYTGLAVKSSRKRLGAVPTSSDNVIVNDLRQLSDTAAELRGDVQGLFGTERPEDVDDEIPILGSFQEGFYDPLTAQPRRIPLEIVACGSGPAGTLTYSSSYASLDDDTADARTTTYNALLSSTSPQRSFSSSTSAVSSDSAAANATYSNFSPALSFNIPGLVALNHPDAVSNGGSSEFFSLPQQNMSKKRAKLLDGQYAPFGYIVSGLDVYQSLKPGDVIGATHVSDVGLLNLVKIRKNAFEGGEDAKVDEKVEDDLK